jgi:hypothetical protein
MMDKLLFDNLVDSLKEAQAISKGKIKASRRFTVKSISETNIHTVQPALLNAQTIEVDNHDAINTIKTKPLL